MYPIAVQVNEQLLIRFFGTKYFNVTIEERKIILMPVKITPVDIKIEDIREKLKKLGITERDVAEAIKWARKKK